MIKETYCSYEVAKLLKEKGFHEPCIATYNSTTKNFQVEEIYEDWTIHWKGYISAPTQQMAMAWLREEKNIFIVIEPHTYDYVNEKNKSCVCSLWVGDNYYEYIESKDYPSYEEAVETALKYCLENLI